MKVNSNKIGDVYDFYWRRLSRIKNIDESKFLIRWLIEEYCVITANELYTNPNKLISESTLLKVHFAVERLEKNEPIHYIINKAQFVDLDFYVNKNVLIPRPETEEMVWKIVEENRYKKPLNIIDICTGSGCIAIALSNLLESKVLATDFSESAIEIAKINSISNKQIIDFFNFNVLDSKQWPSFTSQFDIVVSNPPYVCESEKSLMEANVLNYEPSMALFVKDDDPLIFYTSILNKLDELLAPNGIFYAEINEKFANELTELSKSLGFEAVVYSDFKTKPRFLKVWKA